MTEAEYQEKIRELEALLVRLQTPTPIRKTFEPVKHDHLTLVWSAS